MWHTDQKSARNSVHGNPPNPPVGNFYTCNLFTSSFDYLKVSIGDTFTVIVSWLCTRTCPHGRTPTHTYRDIHARARTRVYTPTHMRAHTHARTPRARIYIYIKEIHLCTFTFTFPRKILYFINFKFKLKHKEKKKIVLSFIRKQASEDDDETGETTTKNVVKRKEKAEVLSLDSKLFYLYRQKR